MAATGPNIQFRGQLNGVPAVSGPKNVGDFGPQPVYVAEQQFAIQGVTRDYLGNILGSCLIHFFVTADDTRKNEVTSDSVTGAYFIFATPFVTCYGVAYKAGSPDVAGTTVNTLVGVGI